MEIYLDLIENTVKDWISIFCEYDVFEYDIEDKYCLLFPEKINDEVKCVMLYIDITYPPFNDMEFKIKNNKYVDLIINEIYKRIKMFYM